MSSWLTRIPEARRVWTKRLVVGMEVDVFIDGTTLNARITAAATTAPGSLTGGSLTLCFVGSSRELLVVDRFSERLSQYEPGDYRGQCPLCTFDVTTKHDRDKGISGAFFHQYCLGRTRDNTDDGSAAVHNIHWSSGELRPRSRPGSGTGPGKICLLLLKEVTFWCPISYPKCIDPTTCTMYY